ncbi:MAG: amidohydrolase family protein [Deltaproteobacteria bacterium]|nr:amidohydrolase family protein [Deltaproteobacteria bacterium]
MTLRMWTGALLIAGCADPALAEGPADVVLRGGTVVGVGRTDLVLRGGKITERGPGAGPGLPAVDVTGQFLVPAFIDSHVHFAYLEGAAGMADGGVVAAVDLAAPLAAIGGPTAPVRVLWSGPMITAPGGYPLNSWGAAGYGLPVTTESEAAAAVDTLKGRGAGVIKLAVTAPPTVSDPAMAAAAAAAHAGGLQVAAHALGDGDSARAAAAGADVLAHTPVETLSDATVEAWRGKAVVSTLAAFGGSPQAVENLRRLRASGVTVLYGTDFGNTRTAGIDAAEIALLVAAGLDGRAILEAGTSAPAAWWGWTDLGALETGKSASLLVLPRDPLLDPGALAAPSQVWLEGARRR